MGERPLEVASMLVIREKDRGDGREKKGAGNMEKARKTP
jgi:hypothetical protein